MNEQPHQPDWRDPFAPEGAAIREPDGTATQPSRPNRTPWFIVIVVVVIATAGGAFYVLRLPTPPVTDRTVVVGLPKTVTAVTQIDVPATLEGFDSVLEVDASGMLGKLCEQAEQGFGVKIPLDQVEYFVAAVNQPTRLLFASPFEAGIDSMLFYLRFKTPDVAAAALLPDTPSTERSDGTRVYEFQGLKAVLVDDRTWLICPENMLLSAQYAFREHTQPDWLEAIDSDEPLLFAGRITGLSEEDPGARYEMLVTASFGDPCVISGRCTTPRLHQAQQLLDDLQQSLDTDYQGLGPVSTAFFNQADLALNEQTVTFDGTIPAVEVRTAMEPVTRTLTLFAIVGAADPPQEAVVPDIPLPAHIPDTPTNRRCWELLQSGKANLWSIRDIESGEQQYRSDSNDELAEKNLNELLDIRDAPPELVAEAHMLLCHPNSDVGKKHFRALQQMEDVPMPIMVNACRTMIEGQFDEEYQLEVLDFALQLAGLPDHAAAEFHLERARLCDRNDQLIESREERIELIRSDASHVIALPRVSDAMRAEALTIRAFTNDDVESRIADLTSAIELPGIETDTLFTALHVRAQLRERLLDFDGALADYTALCELEDSSQSERADALIERAVFHFSQQEVEAAKADFARAIELDEIAKDSILHRARFAREHGDDPGALRWFRAFRELRSDVSDEVAEEVNAAIEELSDSPALPEAN